MKIKVIDLLFFFHEKRLEEGFKFIFKDEVLEYKTNNLIFTKTNICFGYKYPLEQVLNDEITILTPELIKFDEDNTSTSVDDSVKKEDIDSILSQTLISVEKYGDKTTILKATLPNGFVVVESSSCVDPKNFNMSIGEQICMKKLEEKIWELEGYKLQNELSLNL